MEKFVARKSQEVHDVRQVVVARARVCLCLPLSLERAALHSLRRGAGDVLRRPVSGALPARGRVSQVYRVPGKALQGASQGVAHPGSARRRSKAEISFKTVPANTDTSSSSTTGSSTIAHYELGRLYAGTGRDAEAKEQLNLVLSQKTLEDRGRKGKYSLQNMVHLRANGALNAIDGSGK
ncbi:hypothetical protein L1887_42092 [Cichorium endivia]|nr:hypothetical protein L1887_42092 [Cichorium endivia]